MNNEQRIAGAIAVRRAITSCARCVLRMEARHPVPFRGPLDPVLAVLGEAPGRTEDQEGKPFVGPAGRFLDTCLRDGGFDPGSVAFINAACCFPSRTGTPTSEHIQACRVHLVGQLNAIQPSHLLTVGVTAFSAVMPATSRIKMRGLLGRPWWLAALEPWPSFYKPMTVLSSYHPAARSPAQKLRLKEDVAFFYKWISDKQPFPSGCYRCNKEVAEWDDMGIAWCNDHKGKQGVLV